MSLLITNSLKAYFNDTNSPSLSSFIYSNKDLFESHDFPSLTSMENFFYARMEDVVANIKPGVLPDLKGLMKEASEAISFAFDFNKKATPAQTQSIVALWFALEEGKNLEEVMAKVSDDIEQVRNLQSTNPTCQLDKMSIDLLSRYDTLSHQERIVLKLSLSHVVSMLNSEHETIYKKYIKKECYESWKEKKQQLEIDEDERVLIDEVFSAIIEATKTSINDGLKYILKEQLSLLESDKRNSTRYDLLQAASYILHNIDEWQKSKDMSEAEIVSRVNGLLKIIFCKTNLKLTIGETTADCTKASRVSKETQYSGGSSSFFFSSSSPTKSASNISGRNIDLKIQDNNGIELSLCEFKKNNDRRKLAEQQGKCIRLNVALMEDLKSIQVYERLVTMTWGGHQGRMICIEEVDGVYLASHIGQAELPVNKMAIDDFFVEGIKNLYKWKKHLVNLSQKVSIHNNRFGGIVKQRDVYTVCFTPKLEARKRQRTHSS